MVSIMRDLLFWVLRMRPVTRSRFLVLRSAMEKVKVFFQMDHFSKFFFFIRDIDGDMSVELSTCGFMFIPRSPIIDISPGFPDPSTDHIKSVRCLRRAGQ